MKSAVERNIDDSSNSIDGCNVRSHKDIARQLYDGKSTQPLIS